MVSVRLAKHSRALLDGFHQHLLSLPEVLACYHVAGADDFLAHVGVRDSEHLRNFTLTALTERDEVAHIETRLIFEFQRNVELPVRSDAPA
jgi:DNA-binding Lrp family transcriptional regulator